jgi:hypothetical protein
MATESVSLSWSAPFAVAPVSRTTKNLHGDKILLPPSALEQLLAASTVTVDVSNHHQTPFDPFNPYSLAAARQERSQWRDTQQQLPHPLTFRLVNPQNGNVVHAGIREFSAEDGEIGLSPFLREALGLGNRQEKANGSLQQTKVAAGAVEDPIDLTAEDEDTIMEESERIVVHAKQLPKGTYVRLRPLEAGYNPEDWKALLERHLRDNYTTLTNGEILTVPGDRATKAGEFRFLIDKFAPEGDGICVVDTDLEVDIEALNEDQARETMKQIMSKSQRAPGTAEGSSPGGVLDIWNAAAGQVLEGEYVDYQIPSWDRSAGVEVELTLEDDEEIDLFVSPLAARQRAKPRDDEHVFGDFTSNTTSKVIRLHESNVELEGAEALFISVYGSKTTEESIHSHPRHFSIRVRSIDKSQPSATPDAVMETHGSDEEQCKNCHQWVPSRTMILHTNFCLRNNILCPHCEKVFKKGSPEWVAHWHCPHDDANGNSSATLAKHNRVFHSNFLCPACEYTGSSLPGLARHRTTLCPGKIILCQFCHLSVPQEGDPFNPSADALLSGLTEHELADGARTTNCHLCNAIVRLRDMNTHLKHHDLSRQSKPLPRICRNINCGRTLDGVGKNGDVGKGARMGQGPGNELGLCSICFGPLYVSMHDPEGRAMKRRIERRYIGQLIQGCGKSWCANAFCKLGRQHTDLGPKNELITTKEALPMLKPLMDALPNLQSPIHFCVDEGSQKRRKLAEMLSAEGEYELEWCVAACEAENGDLDSGRGWLRDWAPKLGEAR